MDVRKAYIVVACPGIAKHDFDEIQAFRRVDDVMYYRVVKPHFAIVLPVFDWDNAPHSHKRHVNWCEQSVKGYDLFLKHDITIG